LIDSSSKQNTLDCKRLAIFCMAMPELWHSRNALAGIADFDQEV